MLIITLIPNCQLSPYFVWKYNLYNYWQCVGKQSEKEMPVKVVQIVKAQKSAASAKTQADLLYSIYLGAQYAHFRPHFMEQMQAKKYVLHPKQNDLWLLVLHLCGRIWINKCIKWLQQVIRSTIFPSQVRKLFFFLNTTSLLLGFISY